MKKVKTIFLGSSWESVESLKLLHQNKNFDIIATITPPDKPYGRKQKLKETKVKKYAHKNKIPVLHTKNKKTNYQKVLKEFKPELLVCKAFGELIPEFFLEEPIYKAINIHFSLLPKYRGAVPVQMAILNGDSETGITIVKMVKKLDAGEILTKAPIKINENDTNLSLRKKLVEKNNEILIPTLIKWCKGAIKTKKQDDTQATYCYQSDISKKKAFLDFNKITAIQADRMIRAFIPWPIAWCYLNKKRVKILKASPFEQSSPSLNIESNQWFYLEDKLLISCKNQTLLEIKNLQMAGKQKVSATDFINGYKSILKKLQI